MGMKIRMRKSLTCLLLLVALMLLNSCARQGHGTLLSAPPPSAVGDNNIYIAEEGGTIRALRPDGTEQWSDALAGDLERVTGQPSRDIQITYLAARSDDKLYGLANRLSGRQAGEIILFALDGNHLVWQKVVPYPTPDVVPLAIGRDAIYEAANDGSLYAFARGDGRTLWQYHVSDGAIGSPTVGGDGTIYINGARQNLHAVAPDGTGRWVSGTHK